MRILRIVFAVLGLVIVSYIIQSYRVDHKKKVDSPQFVYGLPTYPGSQFNQQMSALTGDPYVAVFFSDDSYEKVIKFYKEKLKRDYKVLKYGRKSHVVMEIYQFQIEEGVLKDYIAKGVEVIPLNSRNQSTYNAKTKIKIILPRQEILETQQKQNTKTTPTPQ